MTDPVLTYGVTAAVVRAYSHRLALDANTSPSSVEVEAHYIPEAAALLTQRLRARGVDVGAIAAATTGASYALLRGWVARRVAAMVLMARNTAETPQVRAMMEQTARELDELVEQLMLGSDTPRTGPHVPTSHVQARDAIERANERASWDVRTAWRGRV